MTTTALTEDMALRIGLAARALPDTTPARLMAVLADCIGLPPNAEKLDTLSIKQLRNGASGELADCDNSVLKTALAYLKGTASTDSLPPPAPQSPLTNAEGSDPEGVIRVAIASNNGELLDGHFGSCERFLVYQVSLDQVRLIDCREIDDRQADDDKNGYRAGLIADCQLLYVVSVGGPAAAKVVKHNIHPIKVPDGGAAPALIAELQQIIGDKTPPWLAKIMGQPAESRVRFTAEALEE
ncbi:dinitrogenase iron-molybdenum cofactor biosynthesis protein [Thiorhodovibrio frisius]|uniref:Dinitrogenase iron-molybdenum cofactor biosynthesis protein n=1 Tax=Thiorhodovibrio frisius TaxID=631362 RepID=H8Z4E2_9GAMM|nr:dinitrogenase iron-molybdenum cofactor biosynthesis protein [Thiorhodovibrio frisius]EIC20199.1 dinitrogenase iron-molybdenum cofactor biosynthesis protein [Thiorhodovibrio frisius]WPL20937.1 nitrogen fixation protein NifX [Thiorhodovibrio frisius]